MMDVDYDKAMTEWRALGAEIDAMVTRCAGDPVYQASLGLDLPARGEFGADPPSQTGGLLRACAGKVIPEGFIWDVVTAIGGRAFLVLKGIRREDAEVEAAPPWE